MSRIRSDIKTVVVGGGPVASLVILEPREGCEFAGELQLPIKVGSVETSAISAGIGRDGHLSRPITHDLFASVLHKLGAKITSVVVSRVEGSTFYATLNATDVQGNHHSFDARPSDALALAVRAHAPIYVEKNVYESAGSPNFAGIAADEKQRELEGFHEFVSTLYADDFGKDASNEEGSQL